MHWKTLESKYLIREKHLTVRRDKVRLTNGHRIDDYYVLEYPHGVCTIGITKDKKVIMVRQYRHALKTITYELCAGEHDAEDVDFLATAKREMLEETGYGNGNWQQWMICSPNPGTHTNLSYSFLATDLELVQDQQLDEGEEITVHLLSMDEVRQLLLDNKVEQAMHVAPLWKYLSEYGL